MTRRIPFSGLPPHVSPWYGVAAILLTFPILPTHADVGPPSQCYGTVGHGRIQHAVALPTAGPNFRAYSQLASPLGRTYVHSKVHDVVVASYVALERAAPDKTFVYGETGLAQGGRFRPHRTHQNGLSVDFMVPVTDASVRSVPLPTDATNEYGYAIRFDDAGRHGDYRIDFEAMAEHLYQLHVAAAARGVGIGLVIFEPVYQERLFATRRGAFLRGLPWLKKPAWIRHDGHYHVDFIVPCLPMK
jgi:penicillin-insensitive murein endopeptidase